MKQRLCLHAGCPRFRLEGHRYCEKHLSDETKDEERKRQWLEKKYQHREMDPKKAKYYNSTKWKSFRARLLNERPICEMCGMDFSTEVHHIGRDYWNDNDFYDESMVRCLCKKCHSKITSQRME